MSRNSTRKGIDDPEWEPHKNTIYSLYVDGKLKLERLVETMAEKYGFRRR